MATEEDINEGSGLTPGEVHLDLLVPDILFAEPSLTYGKANDLLARVKRFALDVIRFYTSLPKDDVSRVLGRQLLRSGTSVGANYREARRGRSTAEFIAKWGVALTEADESQYWLELIIESGTCSNDQAQALLDEAAQLTAIFTAGDRTARGAK
jgi:four helix bundle protein